jgi:hypothetical protein
VTSRELSTVEQAILAIVYASAREEVPGRTLRGLRQRPGLLLLDGDPPGQGTDLETGFEIISKEPGRPTL